MLGSKIPGVSGKKAGIIVFTAVIHTCPCEQTADIWCLVHDLPCFDTTRSVTKHILIVAAVGLGKDDGFVGVSLMYLRYKGNIIVHTDHIGAICRTLFQQTCMHRHQYRTVLIERTDCRLHRSHDLLSASAGLQGFFVTHRPDHNAGVVSVPVYHGFQPPQTIFGGLKPAVLIHDQHSFSITGIQCRPGMWIMGKTVAVAAHLL